MYIDQINLENIRTFTQSKPLEFIHPDRDYRSAKTAATEEYPSLPKPRLPNVTLLLGDNGSGKTTVLRRWPPPRSVQPPRTCYVTARSYGSTSPRGRIYAQLLAARAGPCSGRQSSAVRTSARRIGLQGGNRPLPDTADRETLPTLKGMEACLRIGERRVLRRRVWGDTPRGASGSIRSRSPNPFAGDA